ncbi:hypothetical protein DIENCEPHELON_33 [Klebsiella phage vB_KaeS_Diencephalon]|nr:hypothetical protein DIENCEPHELON_33 [Klebsiella phage vB_KaeS_Diencephalon]
MAIGCRKMIKGSERGKMVGCGTYFNAGDRPGRWHVIDNVVVCKRCFKLWKKEQKSEEGNFSI